MGPTSLSDRDKFVLRSMASTSSIVGSAKRAGVIRRDGRKHTRSCLGFGVLLAVLRRIKTIFKAGSPLAEAPFTPIGPSHGSSRKTRVQ